MKVYDDTFHLPLFCFIKEKLLLKVKAELSSSQHKQTNKSDLLHISCQSFVIICTDRMSLSKKRGLPVEVITKYVFIMSTLLTKRTIDRSISTG